MTPRAYGGGAMQSVWKPELVESDEYALEAAEYDPVEDGELAEFDEYE